MNDLISSVFLLMAESATRGAESLYGVFTTFLVVAILVLVIITSVIGYVLFKYRAANREEPPPANHGNRKVEVTLTLITAAVGVFLFYLSLSTMLDTNQPVDGRSPDLIITGHQWWWQVEYPGRGVTTANEIHIPTNEELVLEFRTADVIHSFWVPALGRKMDVISGDTTYLQFKVNEPGTYIGTCSEFCGAQHAWMRIRVEAQPRKAFDQWVQQTAQPAPMPADSMAARGKQLFEQGTCGSCHSIDGTDADGQIGPDLTHLASRETILAGRLKNTRQNLRRWLSNPDKIKPDAHMPKFIFSDKEVNALVAYLGGLK